MESVFGRVLIFFTLFGGWPFRSSGKKRLKNSSETRSEPSTPQHLACSRPNDAKEVSESSRPASTTQPIAINRKNRAGSDDGRSFSHSLPKSYRSTPDSISSSTPRSSSSSQYNSLHNQIWQQAFRNGCR